MRRFPLALAISLLASTASPALAEFPEQPVTMIIPFGAGGGTDVGARMWGPFLERCLGGSATVVAQNQPGASGQIGFAAIAASKPDGYTIGMLNMPNLPIGIITGKASYTLDSFDYLGNIYGTRVTLNVRKDSDIKTLDDLLKRAKEGAAPINIGMSSIGADDHLAVLRFAKLAGIKFTSVPLGDGASARNALLGGHVDVISLSNSEAAPFQEQLLTLAVAADTQVPSLPGVKTFKELGIDLVGGSNHIIGAPKGLPDDVRAKLAGCIEGIGKDPAFTVEAEKRLLSLNPLSADAAVKLVTEETKALQELWTAEPWQ